jgi:LemA protein
MPANLDPNLVAAAISGAVVLVVIWLVVLYNRMIQSRNRVTEAWSGIEVQLRRRASLIPNIVETVRGYAEHERGVFEEVAIARGALQQAGGAAEASSANNVLTQALRQLFAVAENYPQLRASENFTQLQKELSDVEEKIAFARQFYNRNVLDYNTRIQTFPGVVVARNLGLKPAEFFEAPAEGRAEVHVSFARPTSPSPTAPESGKEPPRT